MPENNCTWLVEILVQSQVLVTRSA